MQKKYEIKNGWLICKVAVMDRKQSDMGMDTELEWVDFAVELSFIRAFRNNDDDGEYEHCSTIEIGNDITLTVTIPFADLLHLKVKEY
jgi:hypothetical protein